MENIKIKSLSYYIPEGRINNGAILDKVKSTNKEKFNPDEMEILLYSCERKFDFLGLDTRSYSPDLIKDNIITMAIKSAKKAIEKIDMDPNDIDCVIMAGISNPYREPVASCIVASHIGIQQLDYFDINDTCNGFMKAVEISSLYINEGKYKNILIVTSENPSELEEGYDAYPYADTIDDFNNRIGSLIVGAGAAAMIVSSDGNSRKIIDYKEKKETKNWEASILKVPHTMLPENKGKKENSGLWADARLISATIIQEMPDFIEKCLREWELKVEDIDILITHQLGNNVTFATLDKLKIDRSKAPVNTFRELGNIANANIPINLAIADEQGHIKHGDNIILLNSACGMTFSVTYIKW
ncbi:MAG: 3-oxoacyl-ACP synthase III family protein [bacterium]